MKTDEYLKSLLGFIDKSPTAFHAVNNVQEILSQKGFTELNPGLSWKLEKGGKYFVKSNDSSLIAFIIGQGQPAIDGFRLVAAHNDSPGLKIKPQAEMKSQNYLKLNTEVYGGPILHTWFDRPLSLAGRVSLKSPNPFQPQSCLINFKEPLLTIPSLAIHLDREVNDKLKINKQGDLLPLIALLSEEISGNDFLLSLLSKKLDLPLENILDFELYLYEAQPASLLGQNKEFISAGRLDDLAMVHAALMALLTSPVNKATQVLVLFDNEEIGSYTKQGADSPLLRHTLERINLSLGQEREAFFKAIYNSYLVSADMAHAVHPNKAEKHDPTNQPYLNQGPVIKINANFNYTSDSQSTAIFKEICRQAQVPYQTFVNRSDQRGGSTIGPISATQLNIKSVDIGNPLLAMHSIRELAGARDHEMMIKALQAFYSI